MQYFKYVDLDRQRRSQLDRTGNRHGKRSDFEIDKARIIHSAAFRSLQGKTQVLGIASGDGFRTRLTHSLEVAQLGRGLALEAQGEKHPDPDLVEAICLGHDLGHPPFGHIGERALNELMGDFGGFDANAQTLRVVCALEPKQEFYGLNLTRATLEGLAKFEHTDKGRSIFNASLALEGVLDWISPAAEKGGGSSVEGDIADWVDEVAYCVDDIEDSLSAGLLDFRDAEARASEIQEELSANDENNVTVAEIRDLSRALYKELIATPSSVREQKIALREWTSRSMHRELLAGCQIQPQVDHSGGQNTDILQEKTGLRFSVPP